MGDNVKYLVCRHNLIRPGNRVASSEYWPMVIEANGYASHDEVVREALDSINQGYTPDYEYLVVPLKDASVVSFRKPQPEYVTHVKPYMT